MAITNTTILLTGASRGIGKSLAQSLARQGARVALTARNQETLEKTCEEIRSAGGEAKGYVADAADTARAAEVIKAVEADLGPIDTLINNAGLRGVMGDFWENDLEACWETLTVNILGPMAYAHAASPRMIERGSGCIINMGSYAGVIPLALNASYSASKAALARFGDCLAESLRKHGVHVFTVSPGMVKTDMTSGPELRVLFPNAEWTPMEKIEALVTNLLTRDAAALTGTFIHANDDFDRLLGAADRINEEALYTLRLPTLDGLV